MKTKTPAQIANMANGNNAVGLANHYSSLSAIINKRNLKTGIEIGVAYGGHSKYILDNTKIECLTGIDPYRHYPNGMGGLESDEDYEELYEFAKQRLNSPRYRLIRQTSESAYEMLKKEGKKYDFVFIDGQHTYNSVYDEITKYFNLLKEDGLMSGHDYKLFPEVTKAVDDYALANGYGVKELKGYAWILQK